jgi:hypothetical protein
MTTKNDRIEDNPLVITDNLQNTWDKLAKEYMQDDDFSKTIDSVVKIISEGGNVPKDKVAVLCVKLEAYALKFRIMFTGYMSYLKGTTEANMKKNHYKEMYTGLDRLVDALKYLMK